MSKIIDAYEIEYMDDKGIWHGLGDAVIATNSLKTNHSAARIRIPDIYLDLIRKVEGKKLRLATIEVDDNQEKVLARLYVILHAWYLKDSEVLVFNTKESMSYIRKKV